MSQTINCICGSPPTGFNGQLRCANLRCSRLPRMTAGSHPDAIESWNLLIGDLLRKQELEDEVEMLRLDIEFGKDRVR